jgi:cell division protein FtsW (lipid II flippase)
MLRLKGSHPRLPLTILIAGILVACFGLIAIYDASVADAFETFGDKFHYVKHPNPVAQTVRPHFLWIYTIFDGFGAHSRHRIKVFGCKTLD